MRFKFLTKNLFAAVVMVTSLIISPYSMYTDSVAAQQVNCEEDFRSQNNILMWSPCDGVCLNQSSADVSYVRSLQGDNNGEKVLNFWTTAGLTIQQSAGVTANLKHVSGFNPFRQEASKEWPSGGWGIASFKNENGSNMRDGVKNYLIDKIGADTFNQYYSESFGGVAIESAGFIPEGVPVDINDKFLLNELNYLLEYIKEYIPSEPDRKAYETNFKKSVPLGITLYEYLKTLNTTADSTVAWAYLYKDLFEDASSISARALTASQLASMMNNKDSSGNCSGLVEGGMNLEQAKEFMAIYKQIDSGDPNGDAQYLSRACRTLTDNCVTFSSYFVRKYTTLNFGVHNGAMVVNATLALNDNLEFGNDPRPYSLFGTKSGSTLCDWDGDGVNDSPCGHTGIVLGVDKARDVVIVGEAAYCNDGFTAAREYSLSKWSDGSYTYAYLDQYIKPEVMGSLQ